MLNLTNFTLQSQFNNFSRTLIYNPINPQKSFTIHSKNVNFISFGYVSAKTPPGFCIKASNNELEMEKIDQEIGEDDKVSGFLDEDFDDDDDGGVEVEFVDGEDDELIIPFESMKKWLENKPGGFGEGKLYDTSIEDKLMEEIEQSKKAQIVGVSKVKDSPGKALSKKVELVEKSKEVMEGHRVRVVNLPRKKNIHKDLRLAFQGVRGLISIVPAVHGNKKTRDPVCKGLAFVNFKSEKEASRFVQTFSGQSIAFGRIQKQITCELLKSETSIPAHEKSIGATHSTPRLQQLSLEDNPDAKSEINVPHIRLPEEMSSDEDEDGMRQDVNKISQMDMKPIESNGDNFEITTGTSDVHVDAIEEFKPVPSESKKQKKIPANVKKDTPRRKKEKSPQLTIPGPSKRLQVKEKAMLTDVFSKYVPQAAIAIEERR